MSAADLSISVGEAPLVLAVALAACLGPAVSATTVDPAVALRAE